MVGRETRIPKGSVSHRRSRIRRALSHIAHKRRNVRFKGLWRVHTPPVPLTAHTAAYTAKHGAFGMGVVSLPSERFARFENPARPGVRTANFAAFGPWSRALPKNAESLRNSDAHDARRCSEASRPRWAALLCCWFLRYTGKLRGSLSLHPRAERKICCWGCLVFACGVGDSSLVTEVHFLNRCSRRSMRGTYPLEQRSDCRF